MRRRHRGRQGWRKRLLRDPGVRECRPPGAESVQRADGEERFRRRDGQASEVGLREREALKGSGLDNFRDWGWLGVHSLGWEVQGEDMTIYLFWT